MITAIRSENMKNIVLNVGVFLVGLDYSSASTMDELKTAVLACIGNPEKCLGMTKGGGSFTVSKSLRELEPDGKRGRVKGGEINDMMDASLSATLYEITADNLKRGFGAADVTQDDGKKVTIITPHVDIADSDYIPKLQYFSMYNKGTSALLIELDNAFNVSDATITFTDKGEATLPVEFHAHQESFDAMGTAPFRAMIFTN